MATSGADLVIACSAVVAAFGGVGAAVGTLLAFKAQRDANREIDRRLAQEGHAARRSQADRISVSTRAEPDGGDGLISVVSVRNRSDLPIFDIRVWLEGPEDEKGRVRSVHDVIDVGDSYEARIPLTRSGPGPFKMLHASAVFTDHAQRHWRRRDTGQLTQIEPD